MTSSLLNTEATRARSTLVPVCTMSPWSLVRIDITLHNKMLEALIPTVQVNY